MEIHVCRDVPQASMNQEKVQGQRSKAAWGVRQGKGAPPHLRDQSFLSTWLPVPLSLKGEESRAPLEVTSAGEALPEMGNSSSLSLTPSNQE